MDLRSIKLALERNHMKTHIAKDKDEAKEIVMSMINKEDVVGMGGSMTINQCGIVDELRENYNFLDWFTDMSAEDKHDILIKTMNSDVFLTGTNAITETGELFNVDGRGNRLAAMMFGPKKVIVVAGKNKIVSNLYEARERMDTIAAPQNAKRLNRKTPCVPEGRCVDCDSPERICRFAVTTERQAPGRMEIVLIDEELGL